MGEVIGRDELERRLARAVSKEMQGALSELLEMLGDPPVWSNVPEEWWGEHGKQLRGAITPALEEIYLQQAEALEDSLPTGVDWGMVNQNAVSWARTWAGQLIKDVTDSQQRQVQDSVAAFYEEGLTLGDLESRLERYFGPKRAETIAITEVTRAAVEGERAVATEIEKQGIRLVELWITEDDEKVCPICGPKHERKRGDGWTTNDGPPAHPQCRCWTVHEIEQVSE